MSLVSALEKEVDGLPVDDLHPKVDALVNAFVAYLKEPRYKNPLSVSELGELFAAFYQDLSCLVFHIYTQSNTNKRQLIQKSALFAQDETFDYLNAIGSYSTSSIKLVKRTDPKALFQLRVFALYKFLVINHTMESAQDKLFTSTSSPDQNSLYDKVSRFDSRDIALSDLLSEKIAILKDLDIPIDCFFESSSTEDSDKVKEFFSTLETDQSAVLAEIRTCFADLASAKVPFTKLHSIVTIQKLVIKLCASLHDDDISKVNNDLLLPALIYIIIHHLDEDLISDLHLNFTFVKNFWYTIDPHCVDASRFTLTTSLFSYKPSKSIGTKPAQNKTVYELLNLDVHDETPLEDDVYEQYPEFGCDKKVVTYIQDKYLNNGELQFYLTNFEAILFFLSSNSIRSIVPKDFAVPDKYAGNDLYSNSLHEILDARDSKNDTPNDEDLAKECEEDADDAARSRSSSLFNTITSAVSQKAGRSRSNSALLKNGEAEHTSFSSDFETSLANSGVTADTYGLTRVRNLLERFGSVSHMQIRSGIDAIDLSESRDEEKSLEGRPQAKRSSSFFERLSPGHTRTRSGSMENAFANTSLRRATLTSKFSSGVSEFMTKISTAANNAASNPSIATSTITEGLTVPSHNSETSLHSESDPFDDGGFGDKNPILTHRSSSTQTMDRWFNNIPENPPQATTDRSTTSISSHRLNTMDSNYNDGSLFSAPFEELTKFHNVDFDSLTISDLKAMKMCYDQLCSEVLSGKSASKTSNEDLPDAKEQHSI